MKLIFRKIWAIYGVMLFLLMMLLSLPYVLLVMATTPGERALRRNIWFLHHVFTPIFLALIGIRLKIHGKEKLDTNKSYVIVSNHRSSLDFIVNAEAYPGVFRFLAKEELKKIPIFGWVVKKMCLTVDRSSAMSRARSIVGLKKELEAGMSIFIYPEGGRNRSHEPLGTFYDGAFKIAIQTQAPVAVQTIVNIKDVTSAKRSIDLWPGVVHIVWSDPIQPQKGDDPTELKEKVRSLMLEVLESKY